MMTHDHFMTISYFMGGFVISFCDSIHFQFTKPYYQIGTLVHRKAIFNISAFLKNRYKKSIFVAAKIFHLLGQSRPTAGKA